MFESRFTATVRPYLPVWLALLSHLSPFSAPNKPLGSGPESIKGIATLMSSDRIIRHHLVDRLFHWAMAASMLTLLGTGLCPILGLEFDRGGDISDHCYLAHY